MTAVFIEKTCDKITMLQKKRKETYKITILQEKT